MRLTFGEAFGDDKSAKFHGAFTMLPADAKALYDLLAQVLKPPAAAEGQKIECPSVTMLEAGASQPRPVSHETGGPSSVAHINQQRGGAGGLQAIITDLAARVIRLETHFEYVRKDVDEFKASQRDMQKSLLEVRDGVEENTYKE